MAHKLSRRPWLVRPLFQTLRQSMLGTLAWRRVDAEAAGRAVDQSLVVGTAAGMRERQFRTALLIAVRIES